ncbi:hypothetical protein H2248_007357 [Termitomyces sp. 'cryptogamus']|nr:hypothetical protein H2248_007357 [Termitomyces sp. 'cryptogamus']
MPATSATDKVDSTYPSSADLPHCQDTLDSVLNSPLDGLDDGFCELADRRLAWWDSMRLRTWMSDRGYSLYQRSYAKSGLPSDLVYLPGAERQDTSFPYAHHGGPEKSVWPLFSAHTGERVIVGYALDSQGRHVAIKAVLSGSKEYRILEYLQNQGVPASPDEFQNVIPVLDILSCDGHWLSIMPRWGSDPLEPSFCSMKEVYYFIHCLLKGLNYLHSHRIVHGDIKIENILVNHFDRYHFDGRNAHRRSLCIQGKLTYALFDFSHSTMFPQSVRLDECRLPSYISFGTYPLQRPDDTHQGEIDFNPFAFDVGMLGIVFCNEFQHLTTLAPMLAPLFDMMTTRNVSRRFTAAEALAFFEEQVQPLSPGLEKVGYRSRGSPSYPPRYDTFDRWQDLDPDFVEKWAKFRDAPVPFHVRLLRRLCERSWGWHLVNRIRYIARFITQWTPLCKGKSETLIQG